MLTFDNTHIFTGYIKQLLADFNLPRCKVYTSEHEYYFQQYGVEDPRIVESIDPLCVATSNLISNSTRPPASIVYIKNGDFYNYHWPAEAGTTKQDFIAKNLIIDSYTQHVQLRNPPSWRKVINHAFVENVAIPGVTTTFKTTSTDYTSDMHEYLGEYLRFKRDYYNINLMSMYNCFSNKLCKNIRVQTELDGDNIFELNAYDTRYKIYMVPVKLFEKYTIAIDCAQGVEMACVLYNKDIISSSDLIARTYVKIPSMRFQQPIIFDKLDVAHWSLAKELEHINNTENSAVRSIIEDPASTTRWDILRQEQNLKLLIKVPATCASSIVVLEGDYRAYNDTSYIPSYTYADAETVKSIHWKYSQNSLVPNFERDNLNDIFTAHAFKPISKLQLLAINSGVSYPFADRLIEYLTDNVITPEDSLPDNIRRVQRMQASAGYESKNEGLWETRNQMLIYDYMLNDGPQITKNTLQSTNLLSRPTESGLSVVLPYWSNGLTLTCTSLAGEIIEYKCNPYRWYFNPDTPSSAKQPTVDAFDSVDILVFTKPGYKAFTETFKVESVEPYTNDHYAAYRYFYVFRLSDTGTLLSTCQYTNKGVISYEEYSALLEGLQGTDIIMVAIAKEGDGSDEIGQFYTAATSYIKDQIQMTFGTGGNYTTITTPDIDTSAATFENTQNDRNSTKFTGSIYIKLPRKGSLTVTGHLTDTVYTLNKVKFEDKTYSVTEVLGEIHSPSYSYIAKEEVILQIKSTSPIPLSSLTLSYPKPAVTLDGVRFRSGNLSITSGNLSVMLPENTWLFSEYDKTVLADLSKIDLIFYNYEDKSYVPQAATFMDSGYAVVMGVDPKSATNAVRRIWYQAPDKSIKKWISKGGAFSYRNADGLIHYAKDALEGLAEDEVVFICPSKYDGVVPDIHHFLNNFTQKVDWRNETPTFKIFGIVLGRATTVTTEIINQRRGLHPAVGHNQRGTQFDILGYVDKDAERYYATWERTATETANGLFYVKPKIKETLLNIDIYEGLYD